MMRSILGLSLLSISMIIVQPEPAVPSSPQLVQSCLRESPEAVESLYGEVFYTTYQRRESRIWGFRADAGSQPVQEFFDYNSDYSMALSTRVDPIFSNVIPRQLVETDEQDHVLARVPLNYKIWQYPLNWTLEGPLAVNLPNVRRPTDNGFVLISLENGKLTYEEFRGFSSVAVSPGGYGRPSFNVSPSGQTVIYDIRIEQAENFTVPVIALADVHSKRLLWVTTALSDANHVHWAPNGEQFAYSGRRNRDMLTTEIVLVSQLGEQYTLTNFTDNNTRRFQGGLSWSPDSTQIAFWVSQVFPNDKRQLDRNNFFSSLYVADLSAGVIYDLCLFAPMGEFPGLIWAPDGSGIIYLNFKTRIPTYVDLHNRTYTLLDFSTYEILGWSD